MTEMLSHPEKLQDARLEYGAVPLLPEADYATEANKGIMQKLQLSIAAEFDKGNIEHYETLGALYDLMESALYQSQQARIERNPTRQFKEILVNFEDQKRMADEIGVPFEINPAIERVRDGVATPADLLALLVQFPELGSIELAKLSHPFDYGVAKEMDRDVYATLDLAGATMLTGNDARYKRKGVSKTVPAAIVLRKQTIAELLTDDGVIQVTQRRGFVARGDEGVSADVYLQRKVRSADRFDELSEKIEGYVEYEGQIPEPRWLQPLATSYYARFIADSAEESKSAQ